MTLPRPSAAVEGKRRAKQAAGFANPSPGFKLIGVKCTYIKKEVHWTHVSYWISTTTTNIDKFN